MTAFEEIKTPFIVGIDPGYRKSGMVIIKDGIIHTANAEKPNNDLVVSLSDFHNYFDGNGIVAIETMVYGYGPRIGKETFRTCEWAGRFHQASVWPVMRISRQAIKTFICGSSASTDAGVRFAIRQLFSASGGGKFPEFGIKKKPGPLYGLKSHAIQALAAAIACIGIKHNLRYARQFNQLKIF